MFYLTNYYTTELRQPPYNGSAVIHPTVLCDTWDTLWKFIWNQLWEPSRVVYNSVQQWADAFLIYMTDISNSGNLSKCILFADDTHLFSTSEYTLAVDTSDVKELSNIELPNIH